MPRSPVVLAALIACTLAACDHPAPATAPPAAAAASTAARPLTDLRIVRLRAAMPRTIVSDQQDADNWALARDVAGAKLLVGQPRSAIEAALGAGGPCDGGTCARGETIYAIGQLRAGWNGGTPNLIVTYDAGGTCTGARTIHTQ